MIPQLQNRFGKRLVIDRRGLRPEEMLYVEICIAAGCRYRGVQRAVPECGLEAVILFDDDWGSSCGLWKSEFSLEKVREKLAASNAKWEKSARKELERSLAR
jgi:hypothetical protein